MGSLGHSIALQQSIISPAFHWHASDRTPCFNQPNSILINTEVAARLLVAAPPTAATANSGLRSVLPGLPNGVPACIAAMDASGLIGSLNFCAPSTSLDSILEVSATTFQCRAAHMGTPVQQACNTCAAGFFGCEEYSAWFETCIRLRAAPNPSRIPGSLCAATHADAIDAASPIRLQGCSLRQYFQ